MISEYSTQILWIFNHRYPNFIPSYVVSGIMPADYFGIKKIIFLESDNPDKFLDFYKPKLLIISKAMNNRDIRLLTDSAKSREIKIISIFDDWNFENPNRTKINLPIAINSDLIIAKTATASLEIKKNTSLNCIVIPDPLRFDSHKIFHQIQEPFNLSWFGMHTNHDTIINELPNLNKSNLQINLSLITNFTEKIEETSNYKAFNNLNIKLINWDSNSNKNIVKSDIVILPIPNDKKRLVKSSNRIVDSLNLGRFTITSKTLQFKEFNDFVYTGKIVDGLKWALKNTDEAINKTIKGQKYVSENYSIKTICEKWKKIIINLI